MAGTGSAGVQMYLCRGSVGCLAQALLGEGVEAGGGLHRFIRVNWILRCAPFSLASLRLHPQAGCPARRLVG